MDPNYKNFLAWKKTNSGKEYMKKKDEEELNILRKQSRC
jgi:hypothetical protein